MPQSDFVIPSAGVLNRAASAAQAPQIVQPKIEVPEALKPNRPKPKESGRVAREANAVQEEKRTRDAESKFDREELEKQLEELNDLSDRLGHRLKYGVFEGSEELFVQVLDRRTNELIKMIPSEDILELRAKLGEQVGAILDQEA